MAQTYTVTDLALNDPTSSSWALAWARFIAKDTPFNSVYPQFSLEDDEWTALLEMTSSSQDTDYSGTKTKYYLPWEAVIVKITTDPTFSQQVTEDGYTAKYTDPGALASFMRATYGQRLKQYYPDTFVMSGFDNSFRPRF